MDDPRLEGYNLEERAQNLTDYFNSMALHFKTDNLMHTFGEDFAYTQANTWFKNLDRLANHINANPEKYNIQLKYSSPQEYLEAVNAEGKTYEENNYDFFPYSDNDNSFWTGYFVSRSSLKYHTKKVGRYLQSVRNWFGLLSFYNASRHLVDYRQSVLSALDTIERAMGVLQHHDAVAGTEKQKVADDYTYILANATRALNEQVFGVVAEDYKQRHNEALGDIQTCEWNATARECPNLYGNLRQNVPVLVAVYNPSVQKQHLIRLKVPHAKFSVRSPQNEYLECEVLCTNRTDPQDCEAYFVADLVPFNLNYFKLTPTQEPKRTSSVYGLNFPPNKLELQLDLGKGRRVRFSKYSNELQFTDTRQVVHKFRFRHNFYFSYQNRDKQSSGAYIFRPSAETHEKPLPYGYQLDKRFYAGKIVQVIQYLNEYLESSLRFFNLPNETVYDQTIEQETFLSAVNISDGRGKEVTIDWTVDGLETGDVFYTDSNGLEVQKRVFNERPTWKLNVTQPAAGNYYPIISQATLRDERARRGFTVVPDRAQGATSQGSGHLQVMVQRRLLYDDWRGVSEPLNEPQPWNSSEGVTTVLRHTLLFYSLDDEAERDLPRRIQALEDLRPLEFISSVSRVIFLNQSTGHDFTLTG